MHAEFAAFSATPINGVSAMADRVSPVAEEAEVLAVTGEVAEARREYRRVAAARKNAARVEDDPTWNKDMACIHRERCLRPRCMSCTL